MKYLAFLFIMTLTSNGGCQNKKDKATTNAIPTCIQEKIKQFSQEKISNPPRKIYQYTYKNKDVYLISAPCCDQFEQVVTANCEVVCAPSGGFTGKGDGKCTDFYKTATNKKIIWQDTRKSSK